MKLRILWLALYLCLPLQGWADLRDPTRPLNLPESSSAQTPANGLQAIILSPQGRIAIFNGVSLRRGDHISGFQVQDIQANTVQLAGPDGKIILFLFDQVVKRAR